MKYEEKKSLALTLRYIDDLVEKRLESRLQQLEDLVSKSALVIQEDSGLALVEGPAGDRGPRGFRGPEGYTGPSGQDASAEDVARELRIDESFISKVVGPKGSDGQDGIDGQDGADGQSVRVEDVVEALVAEKTFLESVKGPRGPRGTDVKAHDVAEALVKSPDLFEHLKKEFFQSGEDGKNGIGLSAIVLDESGEIFYTNSEGDKLSAGKLDLPKNESVDSDLVFSEIAKLKEEIKRTRAELTAQVTRAIMSSGGGGSSGGGEVRIEFMDDFDRTVAPSDMSTGYVRWNQTLGKFEIDGTPLGDLGIQSLIVSANPYLVGDGTSALISRTDPINMNDIYSMYIIDPVTREVVEVSSYEPDTHLLIESNASLFDYIFQINYVETPAAQGPWPFLIETNSVLDATGLHMEIVFADHGIEAVETFRLMRDFSEVDGVVFLSDRIIVNSSTPMFGMTVEMMVTYLPGQGTPKVEVPLSGLVSTIDFASRGIARPLNHMVIHNTTNQLVDIVVFLTDTEMRFESSFDMSDLTVNVWYEPV